MLDVDISYMGRAFIISFSAKSLYLRFRQERGNSVCIVTNVTELHGLGRLTHSYSGSSKGKVGKSRMEARKRTLFFLCMCMSSKKANIGQQDFQRTAASGQILIHMQAAKNVWAHFQNCSALSKFTVNDLSSAFF